MVESNTNRLKEMGDVPNSDKVKERLYPNPFSSENYEWFQTQQYDMYCIFKKTDYTTPKIGQIIYALQLL